jgi:hypothetical protein
MGDGIEHLLIHGDHLDVECFRSLLLTPLAPRWSRFSVDRRRKTHTTG